MGNPAIVVSHLPNPKLVIELNEEQEPIAAKRVKVELQWNGPSGLLVGRSANRRTWVFPDEKRRVPLKSRMLPHVRNRWNPENQVLIVPSVVMWNWPFGGGGMLVELMTTPWL